MLQGASHEGIHPEAPRRLRTRCNPPNDPQGCPSWNSIRCPMKTGDAIWDGDTGVLNRYAPPVPGRQPGTISTVVISLHAASRESWVATRGMSDAERNAYEERRIAEEDRVDHLREMQRRTEPPLGMNEERPRSIWGWAADGSPIWDDDPQFG
jgi:hypothetical protein